MNDNDIIGICYWDDDTGRHYGVRGIGPKYDHFYIWIKYTSARFTSNDWPWDYFVFDEPSDHDRLLREFPGDVYED